MKRLIFTLYDDIKSVTLNEKVNQKKINSYFDLLLQNKKDYAKSISCDFKFFHNKYDPKKFNIEDEFVNINLYKHHMFDQMAKKYDEVLYVDFDVLFNTKKNIFDELDLSKGIGIKDQNYEIFTKDIDSGKIWDVSKRSPILKYFITRDLLGDQDNNVMNTGIMIGKSEHIKQIKFVKRIKEITKRIEKLKDPMHWIRHKYHPNNESVFSYILEKHKVPYQLLNEEWHDIRDHHIKETNFGNIVHFINKNFNVYFNIKKKVIFSLYIDIPDYKLDKVGRYRGDNITKSLRTKLELQKYYDKLVKNKIKYAEEIGADFILFEHDEQYEIFQQKFSRLSEYNILNLYKIFLLEKLAESYDYILYLDFDVVVAKNIDFFKYNDVEKFIYCQYTDISDSIDEDTEEYVYDYRAPLTKYWNSYAMLMEKGIEGLPITFNTGIVGASKENLDKLEYFKDIDNILDFMDELKNDEDSFFPDSLRQQFGHDNETIFGYKVQINDVNYENLNKVWHYKMSSDNPHIGDMRMTDPIFIHFINKKFDYFFD